jgi:hypothetical protein
LDEALFSGPIPRPSKNASSIVPQSLYNSYKPHSPTPPRIKNQINNNLKPKEEKRFKARQQNQPLRLNRTSSVSKHEVKNFIQNQLRNSIKRQGPIKSNLLAELLLKQTNLIFYSNVFHTKNNFLTLKATYSRWLFYF